MSNSVGIDPWLAWTRRNPQARVRLFCFPYAGAGALAFRGWSAGLPSTVEVCPVRLPGRETRLKEVAINRMAPLVEGIARAILLHLDKPFAFFGHSMGALLAFEVARQLRRQFGVQPLHLFVSGHAAPQLPRVHPPLHALPLPEFLQKLKGFNGTPPEVLEHAELMAMVIPALRADFSVCETYSYARENALDCPITAFGGGQDPEVSREGLEAWRHQASGAFQLRMFPGDHFFLHTAQPQLLQALGQELHRSEQVEAISLHRDRVWSAGATLENGREGDVRVPAAS